MIKLIIIFVLSFLISVNSGSAETISNINLNIYNIDVSKINDFDKIEKGATLKLLLKNDIDSKKDNKDLSVDFDVIDNEDLKAKGIITKESDAGRLSRSSKLQFSTNKLLLDDGQEVYFSSNSPLFIGAHPPHANTNSLGLARTITSLSVGLSPATFGASLGISFLTSGILSACQNGISDFVWGGLSGSGLSLFEKIFRKQPEMYLSNGTIIPFTLNEDIKISKGIQKEKQEALSLSQEESIKKINQLLQWGDIAGAIELAVKTNQEEIYIELIKKVSF